MKSISKADNVDGYLALLGVYFSDIWYIRSVGDLEGYYECVCGLSRGDYGMRPLRLSYTRRALLESPEYSTTCLQSCNTKRANKQRVRIL